MKEETQFLLEWEKRWNDGEGHVNVSAPCRQFGTAHLHAFTILDAHARFLVRCEALLDPTAEAVQRDFDSAFQELGLPEAIRSDNGPPFASTGPGRLPTLSVWWLTLGLRHERIEPGKPRDYNQTRPTKSSDRTRPPTSTSAHDAHIRASSASSSMCPGIITSRSARAAT